MRKLTTALLILLLLPVTLWTIGAIWFDGPLPGIGNGFLAFFWVILLAFAVSRSKKIRLRFLGWLVMFLVVFIPWSFKKPST